VEGSGRDGVLLRNLCWGAEGNHEQCQDCWSLGQDLHPKPPEYDARVCYVTNRFVIFVVLTAMIMKNMVLWDVNPCSQADVPLERSKISTRLHGITSQKILFLKVFDILTGISVSALRRKCIPAKQNCSRGPGRPRLMRRRTIIATFASRQITTGAFCEVSLFVY
jgi:hypothetical protein